MSGSYRSHRRHRRKSNAGKVGLLGALVGVLGIVAVAVAIFVLRPGEGAAGGNGDGDGGGDGRPGLSGGATGQGAGDVRAPKTGPALRINTPEGYEYAVAAAKSGTDGRPLARSTPPPSGATYAYADYVLTNSQREPVPLEFPADLFVKKNLVAGSARARCMPQPGVPADFCTIPTHNQVTGYLRGSKPPVFQDGDTLMPGGASYVVRVATDLPVKEGLDPADARLYIYNARFASDRKGIEVAQP